MKNMIFTSREDAGKMLAAALTKYAHREDVIVLGLPRGGVPVAFEVAKKLDAPLDVLIVRKLIMPGWDDVAMGAIASGGIRVINDRIIHGSGISPGDIDALAAKELNEVHRREMTYRGHTGAPEVKGKTVILVDDGIATGATVRAAAMAIRQQEPARLVIAVPTAAAHSCSMLEPLADELVVLNKPMYFHAVRRWYGDFPQPTDADVKWLLAQADSLTHAHHGE